MSGDPGTLAAWGPQPLAAVARVLDEETDSVLRARSVVSRDVGGALWSGPDAWAGRASVAAQARLGEVAHRFALAATGLADLASRTEAGMSLTQPVGELRIDLARVDALASVVPDDPLGLGEALLLLAARRRIEEDVATVLTIDRRAAAGLDDACAAAHSLLRQWNTAALRELLTAEGIPPGVPAAGSDPALVADWWASRTATERDQWLVGSPAALGALDGLPGSARDAANRLSLHAFLVSYDDRRRSLAVELRRALDAGDWPGTFAAAHAIDELDRQRDFYETVDAVLRSYSGRPGPGVGDAVPVQLLLAEPDAFGDHGSAAVAFGDVDTAEHVAVVVPGFRQRVVPELGRTASNAWALQGQTASAPGGAATVAWLGYDVPMGLDVAFAGDARAGATRLRATVRGLRASKPGRKQHVTVVAHSYGSTTAGAMLRDWPDTGVGDLVVVGSPGLGVERAGDLHVPADHVWVGAATGDPVNALARFGADPATEQFGARRFDAETGHHAGRTDPFEEHSHYFDAGEPSLANIAAVVSGRAADVVPAPRRFLVPGWPAPEWVDPVRRAA